MRKPILYVCFPVYNEQAALRDFLVELKRVRRLIKRLDIEVKCIAIDDGSTDPVTLDILKEPHLPLHVIVNDHNEGVCGALRTAIDHVVDYCSDRDYMAWLDADGEHKPIYLLNLLYDLWRRKHDMGVIQLVWHPEHMPKYDRDMQARLGRAESRAISKIGEGKPLRWYQHSPGFWMVTTDLLVNQGVEDLYSQYLRYHAREEGIRARWGEDMTFIACVRYAGGVINDSTIVYSHMPAPNRAMGKVTIQSEQAMVHLALYRRFFKNKKR